MKIITTTNRKGGQAKTTTAVNLSHALSILGYSVALIDLGQQAHCSHSLGIEPQDGAYQLFDDSYTGQVPVLNSGKHDLFQVVPGNRRNDMIQQLHKLDEVTFADVRRNLKSTMGEYDYVIIDTEPTGYNQEMALYLADILIVPVTPDYLSVEGVVSVMTAGRTIGERFGRQPEKVAILPVKVASPRRKEESACINDLIEQYPQFLICVSNDDIDYVEDVLQVPLRVAATEATAAGQTILEYSPYSPVAEAYEKVAEWVVGE